MALLPDGAFTLLCEDERPYTCSIFCSHDSRWRFCLRRKSHGWAHNHWLGDLYLRRRFCRSTRSLITTLVDKEHIARLYAAIAIVEILSSLAAGPSIAALYAAGLKLKGPWLTLSFYVLASLCFVSGLGVWCLGLLRKPQEEMPYGDEDRDTIIGNTVFLETDTTEAGIINTV